MNYWLMKSEPEVFGLSHLLAKPNKTEHWDGVRNYQARNMLRDAMQKDDLAFLYHSNCAQPGIVSIMRIVRAGYPDHTALDPRSKYYDPKSTTDNQRWYMVDVKHQRKLQRVITLDELKAYADTLLQDCPLVRRGNRLSVMPLTKSQWDFILSLE